MAVFIFLTLLILMGKVGMFKIPEHSFILPSLRLVFLSLHLKIADKSCSLLLISPSCKYSKLLQPSVLYKTFNCFSESYTHTQYKFPLNCTNIINYHHSLFQTSYLIEVKLIIHQVDTCS